MPSAPFATALFLLAPGAAARDVVPLPPFASVALHNGGEVVVRPGPRQSVTVREGGGDASIRVTDGRLTIDDCPRGCRHGHHLLVEIVTPALTAASVSDGGVIRSEGAFPRQAAIAAAVASGGAIDLRALPADAVTASVSQGGVILASPGSRLDASVSHGGLITYWGRPAVRSSIRQGGVVGRGSAADFTRPLAEPAPPPLPAIPALPPLPNPRV